MVRIQARNNKYILKIDSKSDSEEVYLLQRNNQLASARSEFVDSDGPATTPSLNW